MRVGIPTEIKVQEFRVGITPAGVHALKEAGHTVLVQKGAGLGSMITDEEYVAAGAQMVATAKECWDCDMVVKVKEPLAPEYDLFHEGLILYTYLHLAPEPALTKALLEKKVIGIAYETVQFDNGFLPLLAPMSEVAGRMASPSTRAAASNPPPSTALPITTSRPSSTPSTAAKWSATPWATCPAPWPVPLPSP